MLKNGFIIIIILYITYKLFLQKSFRIILENINSQKLFLENHFYKQKQKISAAGRSVFRWPFPASFQRVFRPFQERLIPVIDRVG